MTVYEAEGIEEAMNFARVSFPAMVKGELARARMVHREPLHSAHEGAAVIREEYDEFWDEVKRKDRNNLEMMKELVQLAAMCQRFAEDVMGIAAEQEG